MRNGTLRNETKWNLYFAKWNLHFAKWKSVLCEMKSVLCEMKICTLRNEICTLRNENLYFAKWNLYFAKWNSNTVISRKTFVKKLLRTFYLPTIMTATHVFHFCRGIERRVLGVLKTQILKPGTAEFFSACLLRITSTNLALSIVLSPTLLSAPGGPALLCFATRWLHKFDISTPPSRGWSPSLCWVIPWRKCTMKERVIPIHFLSCFACTASSCKNIKHLVSNSSLEVCVFHSQFCAFETHCKTKKS